MDLFWLLPTPSLVTKTDGQIIRCNRAFNEMLGIDSNGISQAHIEDFLPLASRVFFQTHLWPLLRQEGVLNEVYFQFKAGNGIKIPILANCHAEQDSEFTIYIWVLYIASERQRFEGELIQARNDVEEMNVALTDSKKELQSVNQQLIIANNELERFVYSVSHDIKAPLVTIEGFARKLVRELCDGLTEKQNRRFERILGNVDHLKLMITELLAQSRIMRQDLKTETVNLKELVKKQGALLSGLVEEIEADINIAENLGSVIANKTLIAQCIQNLLSNAIKYRDPSRKLIIHVTYHQCENFEVLSIKDNGIGIKQSDQTKIFTLFEHLDPAIGSGVGLSIVESIMKKHNGKIEVDSEPGRGSIFSLYFVNDKE